MTDTFYGGKRGSSGIGFRDDLESAYRALDAVLDRFGVELCADVETAFWLEPKEAEKPKLRVVDG